MTDKVMIEFFSGSGIMADTFKEEGYKTFKIDNNPNLNPDLCIDILDFNIDMLPNEFKKPKVIWASPPCTTFSVASIGLYWINGKPKNWKTYRGLAIAAKTVEIIKQINPTYFFIENPRGMLRKQHFMKNIPKKTLTYCQYGAKIQKPTDIWTNCLNWIPKKICKPGDNCHEAAGRGSKGGVQGIYSKNWEKARGNNNYERAKIPLKLCKEIVAAVEGKTKIYQATLSNR